MNLLLEHLRGRLDAMRDATAALVSVESPSSSVEANRQCADAVAALSKDLLGVTPDVLESGDRPHLRWRFGAGDKVLLVGHFDTVWPLGTVDRWRFGVDGDVATGPGAFDMKAGIVQMLFALSELQELDGVTIFLNSDEEIGSPTSRALIEDHARGLRAALVLEPSADGAIKHARKGVSMYTLHVEGRAAHAGLEPEKGVNATVELSHRVLEIAELNAPEQGTTVTPTVASSGTTMNVVPAAARVDIDVRAESVEEQNRIDAALRSLRPTLPGSSLRLAGEPNRPPLPASSSAELLARAERIALDLGLAPLQSIAVGGGSDGNFTAGVGTPTLDGLGAVGAGAHAEGEHILLSAMPERAALVAELVRSLLTD